MTVVRRLVVVAVVAEIVGAMQWLLVMTVVHSPKMPVVRHLVMTAVRSPKIIVVRHLVMTVVRRPKMIAARLLVMIVALHLAAVVVVAVDAAMDSDRPVERISPTIGNFTHSNIIYGCSK
jgi:hypothetical protein